MTSRTFFELQRVRAERAAQQAMETARRGQFQRASETPGTPGPVVYRQHRPDWMVVGAEDPIRRAYRQFGILYE